MRHRIPLRLAWLCISCDSILGQVGTYEPTCSGCGSRELVPLSQWLLPLTMARSVTNASQD